MQGGPAPPLCTIPSPGAGMRFITNTDQQRSASAALRGSCVDILSHCEGRQGVTEKLFSLQVSGSPTEFPKTKEQYVNWGDMDEKGERGSRFRGEPLEPYTKPLA